MAGRDGLGVCVLRQCVSPCPILPASGALRHVYGAPTATRDTIPAGNFWMTERRLTTRAGRTVGYRAAVSDNSSWWLLLPVFCVTVTIVAVGLTVTFIVRRTMRGTVNSSFNNAFGGSYRPGSHGASSPDANPLGPGWTPDGGGFSGGHGGHGGPGDHGGHGGHVHGWGHGMDHGHGHGSSWSSSDSGWSSSGDSGSSSSSDSGSSSSSDSGSSSSSSSD